MAIPSPDELYAIVKVTADTADAFIAKLSAQMADLETVKNGFRTGGLFSFYVPGAMYGAGMDGVRKQLVEAGYDVHILKQHQGYMPSNEQVDLLSIDVNDPTVTGPSTFAWVHVQIARAHVS